MSWTQAIAYLMSSFFGGILWGFVWTRMLRMWDGFTS